MSRRNSREMHVKDIGKCSTTEVRALGDLSPEVFANRCPQSLADNTWLSVGCRDVLGHRFSKFAAIRRAQAST